MRALAAALLFFSAGAEAAAVVSRYDASPEEGEAARREVGKTVARVAGHLRRESPFAAAGAREVLREFERGAAELPRRDVSAQAARLAVNARGQDWSGPEVHLGTDRERGVWATTAEYVAGRGRFFQRYVRIDTAPGEVEITRKWQESVDARVRSTRLGPDLFLLEETRSDGELNGALHPDKMAPRWGAPRARLVSLRDGRSRRVGPRQAVSLRDGHPTASAIEAVRSLGYVPVAASSRVVTDHDGVRWRIPVAAHLRATAPRTGTYRVVAPSQRGGTIVAAHVRRTGGAR